MKIRLFLLIILTLSFTHIYSQNISVKSFRMLESDMDARVNYPKTDQNGEKCAIIKVVTTEQGFAWEGDALGIVTIEKKLAEYWLYVPHGAKRLTVSHEKLGMLRDYVYPIPIKEATVYELVLTTAKVTTIIEEQEITMQWLVINSDPEGADVFIDEQYVGVTPYRAKMEIGSYSYRIEKSMYHNLAGKFELKKEDRTNLKPVLKPNFGYVEINSKLEDGASIEIDGKAINQVTPYTSQKLFSGEHRVTLKKVMFKSKTVDFIINGGQTTDLDIDLEPNFAEVTITTNPEADIYVDEIKKGRGSITERLNPGVHIFEARKEKYHTDRKQQEFIAGESTQISLHPIAKTGSVDIITNPFDAKIKLNGKDYGLSPMTINNLLIGEYVVTLEKESYGTVNKTITVAENKTTSINENLPIGKQININSSPPGASIAIDGVPEGGTPFTSEEQYNLGMVYFNKGVELQDSANQIMDNAKYYAVKKLADDKFKESLPYLEKAFELNPEDQKIIQKLITLYYRLKMDTKYEEMTKRRN